MISLKKRVRRIEMQMNAESIKGDPAVIAAGQSLSNDELDALCVYLRALNHDPGVEPSAEAWASACAPAPNHRVGDRRAIRTASRSMSRFARSSP
jgi:hypothetical protein